MNKASVMVVFNNSDVLVIFRKSGKIGLIGGKSEPNEDPKETAIRECYEESGIKVTRCREIFSLNVPGEVDYFTTAFLAEEYFGEIKSSHEGEIKFVPINDLCDSGKAEFSEYNIKLFREIGV